MEKKCLKCGHVANVPGLPTDACPACGGIYAKVEEYIRNNDMAPVARQTANASPAKQPKQNIRTSSRAEYVELLRSESLYPTARWWINITHTVITALCALGAVFCFIVLGKAGAIGPLLGALAFAALLWLASRIMKELGLMIIDLCDASVRTAFSQEMQAQE